MQEHPIKKTLFSKYHGLSHAVQTIWREESYVAFWKGHAPAQFLSVIFGLVQFSSFELLTKIVWHQLPVFVTVELRPLTHFACGGLAGCCATLASQPFDVIRTRFVAQGEPKVFFLVRTVDHRKLCLALAFLSWTKILVFDFVLCCINLKDTIKLLTA